MKKENENHSFLVGVTGLYFLIFACFLSFFYSPPRYPLTFAYSAFKIALPAAPKIVLCDSKENFKSRTEDCLIRPTVTLNPFPLNRSSLGWGRSSWVKTTHLDHCNLSFIGPCLPFRCFSKKRSKGQKEVTLAKGQKVDPIAGHRKCS